MSTAIQKGAVLFVGGGVVASSAYLTYHWKRMEHRYDEMRKGKPEGFSFVAYPGRNLRYDTVASCYDDALGRDEFYMGIHLMRRALLRFHATGTVLEVGAGTGRNMDYYLPHSTRRVLLTDASDSMLQVARDKAASRTQKYPQFAFLPGRDAASDLRDLPDSAFDTVVDTFGLCSYDDPVAVLKEMGRLCKKKDGSRNGGGGGGKILLLEHGRSKTWDLVTRHLDKHAEQHAANWGCCWNRDLDAVLEESGLEIEILRTFNFGTTYYVVCRPPSEERKQQQNTSTKIGDRSR
jgi:methyltransferase OMS1, mitochondrial